MLNYQKPISWINVLTTFTSLKAQVLTSHRTCDDLYEYMNDSTQNQIDNLESYTKDTKAWSFNHLYNKCIL